MNNNLLEIKEKVLKAINKVLKYDKILFEINSSERSIAFRLATYIEKEFPEWNVDFEYNRYADEIKVLKRDKKDKNFLPDIVVHKRTIRDNLLVIEIKKSSESIKGEKVKWDRERLEFLTTNKRYEYDLGVFVYFYVKLDSNKPPIIEYYKEGKRILSM